jgi:hypothetical protein
MKSPAKAALATAVLVCALLPASAQWTQQTLALQPGWNAVCLEIDPVPNGCDAVFEGVPVEGVWAWNRKFSPVQFVQNPDEMLAGRPEMTRPSRL